MSRFTTRERSLLSGIASQFGKRSAIAHGEWTAQERVTIDELDQVFSKVEVILLGSLRLLDSTGEKVPERYAELLTDLAGHFHDRCAIGHDEWQKEKQVTIDEIDEIFMIAEAALRGFLSGSETRRHQIITLGALVSVMA
jgi:hypothetical protein